MRGKRLPLWEKAQQQRRDSDSLLLTPHPCVSCLFMIAAPFAGDRSRFVIPSVTKPKKPSIKKTSRDKKISPGNHDDDSRTTDDRRRPTTTDDSRTTAGPTTGPARSRPAGPDIARHCKLAFQAYVSNKRLLCLACVRVRACGGGGARARVRKYIYR